MTSSAATLTTADINGGTIDGVTINSSAIGGTTAAAATFTTLNATGNTTLANMTANAATLTTADINGGTINGATINSSAIGGTTAAAATFTTLNATGKLVWSTKSDYTTQTVNIDGEYTMHVVDDNVNGAYTINLPTASAVTGQIVYVAYSNTTANDATLATASGVIYGDPMLDDVNSGGRAETAVLIFDGTNWYRITNN